MVADLLTMEQAAKQLAVSAKHLRREFVNKGLLAVVSMGKGCKGDRIDPEELARFKKSRGMLRCSIKEETFTMSNSKRVVLPINAQRKRPVLGRLKNSSVITVPKLRGNSVR